VVLSEQHLGVLVVSETDRSGRFEFASLGAGDYELLVERLGYRPVRLLDIPVRPGQETALLVQISAAPPPVEAPLEVRFQHGVRGQSRAGSEWWLSDLELSGLPEDGRDLAELARFASVSDSDLEIEGLPAEFTSVAVDGVPYTGVRHPGLTGSAWRTAPFSLFALDHAQLLTNGLDVEWANGAGATLAAGTRGGTRNVAVRFYGDWTGDVVADSRYFAPEDVSHNSGRGGVIVNAPIVRDSVHVLVGAEGLRTQAPFPGAWVPTTFDSLLVQLASDSFGVDLAPYLGPRRMEMERISVFGRLDWKIAAQHALTVRGNATVLDVTDPVLGPGRLASLGSDVSGDDVSAAATLASQVSDNIAIDVRIGLEVSNREFSGSGLPASILVDGPVAFGTDPTIPGRFKRVGFVGSQTARIRAGQHRFKLGFAADVASHDITYDPDRGGTFVFSGLNEFARGEAQFDQSVGPPAAAQFTLPRIAGFFQDRWTASPGLEVQGGLRLDADVLPQGDITLNEEWQARAGIANNEVGGSKISLSPRFGLTWDVDRRRHWLFSAQVGVYQAGADPALLGEAITRSGDIRGRRGLGDVGPWPATPDSTDAPPLGPDLTILTSDYRPPSSVRSAVGVTGLLGGGTVFHLSGVYRHTDYLPRRHDLNLVSAPTGADQYGRAVYGTLEQQGGLLAAVPGTNRQFTDFGLVSAIDPDGTSDYFGVTARVERRIAPLRLSASYTFSRTEDNWLGAAGGGPDAALTPFPDSLARGDWADGRSDFDRPHRAVVGAELAFGFARLAAYYRFESGRPFTPGFRDGVDANADGSARNDPAFVDENLPGVQPLFAEWDCLSPQVGQFAKRNSCRSAGVHTLDVRLAAVPFRLGGAPVELIVDGLNLLDSDVGDVDRALYLVDPSRALSQDPATGAVTVPLIVNPNFGERVARRTTGRRLRVGIRVNYD